MKLDQILKSAEAFEKLAAFDFEAICKNYGAAIQTEVAGGIKAINKLVTTNRAAANSHAISTLDDLFGKIGEVVRNINAAGAAVSIRDLRTYIGNGTFYTSSFNSGTGYDPVTREGGAWSPAACLNRINIHVTNLEKWLNYNNSLQKKEVAPGRHDPSLPTT